MPNQYIQHRGTSWVILNKTGRVLTHHTSRAKAEASFRAMEAHKHDDQRKHRGKSKRKKGR